MMRPCLLLAICAVAASALASSRPQTSLWLDQTSGVPGSTVAVRVWIKDALGTPLGAERPPGQRIQGIALKVRCLPEGAVEAVTAQRAGVTAAVDPLFSAAPSQPGAASLIASFSETHSRLAIHPALPAAQVAVLQVRLARRVAPGTVIEIRLDPEVTMLGNQAGTVTESVRNGWLTVTDGRIRVQE